MKILINPVDVIERCLWDDFEYYVLPKNTNIEEFIEKNEEFIIDEKDALVIGLLKCIETNNLSHRLNQYIQHFMSNRSFSVDSKFFIRKKLLIETISKFSKKFPDCWKPGPYYKKPLDEVMEYIKELMDSVETLKVNEYTDKFGTHEIVELNHVKKILKHHN